MAISELKVTSKFQVESRHYLTECTAALANSGPKCAVVSMGMVTKAKEDWEDKYVVGFCLVHMVEGKKETSGEIISSTSLFPPLPENAEEHMLSAFQYVTMCSGHDEAQNCSTSLHWQAISKYYMDEKSAYQRTTKLWSGCEVVDFFVFERKLVGKLVVGVMDKCQASFTFNKSTISCAHWRAHGRRPSHPGDTHWNGGGLHPLGWEGSHCDVVPEKVQPMWVVLRPSGSWGHGGCCAEWSGGGLALFPFDGGGGGGCHACPVGGGYHACLMPRAAEAAVGASHPFDGGHHACLMGRSCGSHLGIVPVQWGGGHTGCHSCWGHIWWGVTLVGVEGMQLCVHAHLEQWASRPWGASVLSIGYSLHVPVVVHSWVDVLWPRQPLRTSHPFDGGHHAHLRRGGASCWVVSCTVGHRAGWEGVQV
ncbi:hypothetical protein HD554DRAFT_2253772 [Boletus coccyginus]|nr:hypothetical protein HD554DRAFT_2253772 [Boletus coccyginus]